MCKRRREGQPDLSKSSGVILYLSAQAGTKNVEKDRFFKYIIIITTAKSFLIELHKLNTSTSENRTKTFELHFFSFLSLIDFFLSLHSSLVEENRPVQ